MAQVSKIKSWERKDGFKLYIKVKSRDEDDFYTDKLFTISDYNRRAGQEGERVICVLDPQSKQTSHAYLYIVCILYIYIYAKSDVKSK